MNKFVGKTVSLVVLICLGLLLKPQPAQADYAAQLKDYQVAYTTYRRSLVEYQVGRSEYLTYKTLVSRERAISLTQQMLLDRNLVLEKYLDLLKQVVADMSSSYLSEDERETLNRKIELEQTWLQENQPAIRNTDRLEDIVTLSDEIDQHIANIQALGFEVKSYYVDLRMRQYLNTANNLFSLTSSQIRRIQQEGKRRTDKLSGWLIDAEFKFNLAQTTHNKAGQQLTLFEAQSYEQNQNMFDKFRAELLNSRQYLREGTDFLLEIVRNIKIQPTNN